MDCWTGSLKEILFVRRRPLALFAASALPIPLSAALALARSLFRPLSSTTLNLAALIPSPIMPAKSRRASERERGKEGRKKGGRKQAGEQGTVDDRSNEGEGPHHRGKTADVAHRLLLLLLRRVLGKK